MNVNDSYSKKIILGKAYIKSYQELFSDYFKKLKDNDKKTSDIDIAVKFSKDQKKLYDTYETERYKIYMQEEPSIHTMYAATNYKQSILVEDMNNRLNAEYDELQKKLSSGKYGFFERTRLEDEYEELKTNLQDEVFKEVNRFKNSYYEALKRKNTSKIDDLEKSLLPDLLSKI